MFREYDTIVSIMLIRRVCRLMKGSIVNNPLFVKDIAELVNAEHILLFHFFLPLFSAFQTLS